VRLALEGAAGTLADAVVRLRCGSWGARPAAVHLCENGHGRGPIVGGPEPVWCLLLHGGTGQSGAARDGPTVACRRSRCWLPLDRQLPRALIGRLCQSDGMKSVRTGKRQYACVPIRLDDAGTVEVLLITSRGTGRWVVPKGWPMVKVRHRDAAAIEAFEEAGVRGRGLGATSIGAYRYAKTEETGAARMLDVIVYALLVEQELDDWPERVQRTRRWFTPHEAAALVAEVGLARIIRRIPRVARRVRIEVGDRVASAPAG
jgi:8-oxo-dGTP pyrophosphatase MutT (NUDIX family)